MMKLTHLTLIESIDALRMIPDGKVLINTVNAHSFNIAQKDELFAEALMKGDYLIPDGVSIVKACRWLKAKSQPKERIAGWDLFTFEMQRLDGRGKTDDVRYKVMFVGSSESVLQKIKKKAALNYSHLDIITLSPPFKREFSEEDISEIIKAINASNPDLLWIGMTAPKQEKLVYQHWQELDIHCHVGTIGAVFDFYAGTVKRAPKSWQDHSMEWLYRFIRNPKRMWRRYLLGNPLFVWNIFKEKFFG